MERIYGLLNIKQFHTLCLHYFISKMFQMSHGVELTNISSAFIGFSMDMSVSLSRMNRLYPFKFNQFLGKYFGTAKYKFRSKSFVRYLTRLCHSKISLVNLNHVKNIQYTPWLSSRIRPERGN